MHLELIWFGILSLLTSHGSLNPDVFCQHHFPKLHSACRCAIFGEQTVSLPLRFYQHRTPGIWQVLCFRMKWYEGGSPCQSFLICSAPASGQHEEMASSLNILISGLQWSTIHHAFSSKAAKAFWYKSWEPKEQCEVSRGCLQVSAMHEFSAKNLKWV